MATQPITRVDTTILDKLAKESPDALEDALRKTAVNAENKIKMSFGTSPPGRTYQRGGVQHTASQPGFPPSIDTGALRASIGSEQQSKYKHVIFDGVDYGVHLELGTERVQARPFMRPVIDEAHDDLTHQVKQELKALGI